jgi:predicted heme/steroid binding protein
MATPPRYRKPAATAPAASPSIERAPSSTAAAKSELKQAVKQQADKTSSGLSLLDVLRILGGVMLLSAGLSYLATSGESMTWGYNAKWTRAREWMGMVVSFPLLSLTSSWEGTQRDATQQLANAPNSQRGDVHLTDAELKAYDGSDPTKPIYLAINGTIYDVSSSPTTYGPGGSYHFFAGRDAARAFLTGCFAEDAVPDLRGVEQMFIPVDPETKESATPEVIEKAKSRPKLSSGELKNRNAQELRDARRQARDGLEGWHALFRGDKGKPYFKVGTVKREEGWLEKLPQRTLCAQAQKGRPARKYE